MSHCLALAAGPAVEETRYDALVPPLFHLQNNFSSNLFSSLGCWVVFKGHKSLLSKGQFL
jgi:hypothetical protein